MWTEESQAIRTSLPSSLGACHLPERDGAPSSGLWSEPRNRRQAGLGLDGHCPILCTFTGLSFRLGVLLPAETGVGGAGVGNIPQLGPQAAACAAGGKSPWFPGSDPTTAAWQFVTVGWRAVQSWNSLIPNTVTRSPWQPCPLTSVCP